MFRILKTMRIQDSLPETQKKYLFSVACIAAANQCENNYSGKPLFFKTIARSTFIAQNYVELQTARSNPNSSLGLLSY
jgi:hypothetical protein